MCSLGGRLPGLGLVLGQNVTWQPALSTLGAGGSGTTSQSTFMTEKPLAFKRFHDPENSDGGFLPMMSGFDLESTAYSKSPKYS